MHVPNWQVESKEARRTRGASCAAQPFPIPLREGVRGSVGCSSRSTPPSCSCAPPTSGTSLKGRGAPSGFTLLETALAIVIVGVGVLAIVAAQQAFHKKNSWSTHASIASALGNEVRELSLNLPRHDPVTGQATWGPETGEVWVGDYDDLDDFDGPGGAGLVFSAALGNGPINARREIIPNMEGWSQTVHVYCVDPFDITAAVSDGASNVMMVEVVIEYQGPQDITPQELTRVSWIAPN